VHESIRSLQVGVATTPGFDEVLLSTFGGRVLSLTTEPLKEKDDEDEYGRSRQAVAEENNVGTLRKELEKLREKVEREKGRLNQFTDEYIPVQEQFKVNFSCSLDPSDGTYLAKIEIPVPLNEVTLQVPFII
jgi:Bardet-Biedl syndrome 7 protein